MRSAAKAVNFGIVYGISAFSLAQDIGVSNAEAKAYMERYFEKYSGVHAYMTDIVEQAKRDGFVSTLIGRRRWLPEDGIPPISTHGPLGSGWPSICPSRALPLTWSSGP